jgi:hypothetical protein
LTPDVQTFDDAKKFDLANEAMPTAPRKELERVESIRNSILHGVGPPSTSK